jgi:copper(I)-binding protein
MMTFLRTVLCAAGFVLAAAPLAAHEYQADGFTLIHPWADATEPGATDAPVHYKLEDVTREDRLIRGSTPYAERVEVRGTEAPQVVLHGLKAPLEWGRSYLMTLEFEKAGPIVVMISVGAH